MVADWDGWPDEVTTAHGEGRLVLCVGGGGPASAAVWPFSLDAMIVRIARESCYEPSDSEMQRPDRLMGDLQRRGVDVHLRVHLVVSEGASRPAAADRAIVAVALAGAAPRIVTTRYDRRLSAAAAGHDLLREHDAAALPPGSDFGGLVYLHGSVAREPRRMLVTAADLDRAYYGSAPYAVSPGLFTAQMYERLLPLLVDYDPDEHALERLLHWSTLCGRIYALTDKPDHDRWNSPRIVAVPCRGRRQMLDALLALAGADAAPVVVSGSAGLSSR